MSKKTMDKKSKTTLLVILIIVFGVVALYAAQSGDGNLFQGALRTTYDLESTDSKTGISRTAAEEEEDVRSSATIDVRETDDDIDYSGTLSADTESDEPIRETTDGTDDIRQAEQIEQSYDLAADSESDEPIREATESDVRLQDSTLESAPITATTTDSYSTTINAGTETTTNVRAVAPECPEQLALVYRSDGNDAFSSLLTDIDNNTECLYHFVLDSPNMNEAIVCEAGSTSAYNGIITCNKFAHDGDLHILVRIEDGMARSSYRLDNSTAIRTHMTSDFAAWKVAPSS